MLDYFLKKIRKKNKNVFTLVGCASLENIFSTNGHCIGNPGDRRGHRNKQEPDRNRSNDQ